MMPKCSRCHAIKPDQCFGPNVKGEFYKMCIDCRVKNREQKGRYYDKHFRYKASVDLRVDCACGGSYRYKSKHLQTKCHKDYLERLRLEESTTAEESDEHEDVYACYYEGSDENEEGTCGQYVLSDSDAD